MQAHFNKKKYFIEENSIKCPVLYTKFEEQRTFNVKTQRITRQKNQNRARYAGAF